MYFVNSRDEARDHARNGKYFFRAVDMGSNAPAGRRWGVVTMKGYKPAGAKSA